MSIANLGLDILDVYAILILIINLTKFMSKIETRKPLHLMLQPELHAKLKEKSVKDFRDMTKTVQVIIRDYFDGQEK